MSGKPKCGQQGPSCEERRRPILRKLWGQQTFVQHRFRNHINHGIGERSQFNWPPPFTHTSVPSLRGQKGATPILIPFAFYIFSIVFLLYCINLNPSNFYLCLFLFFPFCFLPSHSSTLSSILTLPYLPLKGNGFKFLFILLTLV